MKTHPDIPDYPEDSADEDFIAFLAAMGRDFSDRHPRGGWPFSRPGGEWEEVWAERPDVLRSSAMVWQIRSVHGDGSPAVRVVSYLILADLFTRIPTEDPRLLDGLAVAREFAAGLVRGRALRRAHDGATEVYQSTTTGQDNAVKRLGGAVSAATLHPGLYNIGLVMQMAHAALRASWGVDPHTVKPTVEQPHDAADLRADAVHVALIQAHVSEPFAVPSMGDLE